MKRSKKQIRHRIGCSWQSCQFPDRRQAEVIAAGGYWGVGLGNRDHSLIEIFNYRIARSMADRLEQKSAFWWRRNSAVASEKNPDISYLQAKTDL